jgi:ubiquinone/menaquinone biosynthesis C-methylase UbiE
MESAKTDIQAIKQIMKATWEDGDFGKLSKFKEEWDEDFLSRLPISEGTNLLDVACGTGYFCILAAKKGAKVTGVDIATNLIEQARDSAKAHGVNIRFDEGDAEALPYADNSFDIVTSMVGAMFAPQPDKVAAELLRVCKPGGIIAMANWTAEGITGEMFGIAPKYLPPPRGVPYPLLWGSENIVRERFGNGISDLRLTRRIWQMKFPFGEAEAVEFFSKHFGPVKRTLDALSNEPEKQKQMKKDLFDFYTKHNHAADGTVLCDAEWLEVIATKG